MPTLRSLCVAAASAALLISLAGCATPAATDTAPTPTQSASALAADGACEGEEGVTVVVDASALEEDDASGTWCVPADGTTVAADVLAAAGVQTEGTDEYGDQVVCRVDGVPAEDLALTAEDGSDYFESCESMPAAFAYWSIWVQPAGEEWGYAQEGLSTQQLEPGDAIELLFTLNGEPAEPAALTS